MEISPEIVRNSYGDGIFATMFATLAGGVFLAALALSMGMSGVYLTRRLGYIAHYPDCR